MKMDLRCKRCDRGPADHPCPELNSACNCDVECSGYVSPLTRLELAVALDAVDREAEGLREFRRLVEYAERSYPTMWFGTFSKLRDSLRERMKEEQEGD